VASLSFVIGGIAVVRIYARLFLGPHVKKYHSTANKSS
jgi:NADH-quinone oxidoreductase subunit L